ncbi:MAG: AAA family ATPase [Planctomycetota bacterium]|jgi:archaellum biogenesis ATPase FlaH
MNKNQLEKYVEKVGLPSSPEHEAAVVSALLNDKTVLEMLTEAGIDKEYFYSPTMKNVYLACSDLVDQGKDIDILSVKAYLKQNHSSENVLNVLTDLLETEVFTFQASTHIDGLIEFYQRREQARQSIRSFKESYNGKFTVLRNADIMSSLESWNNIQNMDIKVEWIIERHIPKGSITLVFGKGGIGKTWLLLGMARCIGKGIPFLGYNTNKTPVIFIDFENPLAVINTRTQTLGDGENVFFWRAHNENLKAPKLDSKEWELYKNLPKEAVLIFDTLRASQSKDENASNEMGLIMGRLKELRDLGFTIILLHHTAKNSDHVAKGSTAIVDLADHILGLTLVKKKSDGQEIVVDDDDNDETAIYRFGVREKTRYEPYHVYLTLNPDKGFELAPDPQEDTLKNMHEVLLEHGYINKTSFIESCSGLGVSNNKLRKLVDIGQGRYWDIENRPDQKNAKFITPKSVF